jgi:hypothetical protein
VAQNPAPGDGQPDRRQTLAELAEYYMGRVRELVGPAPWSATPETCAQLMDRLGAGPYTHVAVWYAAVITNADGVAESVVGVFPSPSAASAYGNKQGWPGFTVAPYQVRRPSWE